MPDKLGNSASTGNIAEKSGPLSRFLRAGRDPGAGKTPLRLLQNRVEHRRCEQACLRVSLAGMVRGEERDPSGELHELAVPKLRTSGRRRPTGLRPGAQKG